MLTLPVIVIETAGIQWSNRVQSWTLQVLHQIPEPHLWLNCWGWGLAENSSRVDVRLGLNLRCLLHRVSRLVLKHGIRMVRIME